jgi:hypothetical protein
MDRLQTAYSEVGLLESIPACSAAVQRYRYVLLREILRDRSMAISPEEVEILDELFIAVFSASSNAVIRRIRGFLSNVYLILMKR